VYLVNCRALTAALGVCLLAGSASAQISNSLEQLPTGSVLRGVTAVPAEIKGRKALRVELTDAVTSGKPGVDFGDGPTLVIIPAKFKNGTIAFDVLSRLNGKGPPDARAFAGVAYRITDGGDHFEAVYLRPLNGRPLNPPAPRDKRAIEYFAYPDWKFDRLRKEFPDGRYESGADILPNEWIHVQIDVDDRRVRVAVNGNQELLIDEARSTPMAGNVGLFVDIGTEAFFADLRVIEGRAR